MSSMMHGHGQSLPYACAGTMESYGVQGMPNSVYFWEVDGGRIVDSIYSSSNDTIVIRWDYDRRLHSIAVTEQTEFGCYGIPVGGSIDVNAPVANIGDNQNVCQNDQYTFDATTAYNTTVTYLWPDNSTGSTFTTGTEGYVWVKITGADNCSDYDSTYLTLNPLPIVNIGKDTTLCGTETMLVDAGSFSSYQWSTGDIVNPIAVDGRRTEPELLWVDVTDANGCRGSDTLILEVCDASLLFANMPNTITPGGDGSDNDGYNDTWEIDNIDLFPGAILEIYDRWGRLVYRTDDIANNPWKGETMSGKQLPMDAYYYVLDLKVAHVKPLTGYVNLIR
jgi:gliding motility-associated-like protein